MNSLRRRFKYCTFWQGKQQNFKIIFEYWNKIIEIEILWWFCIFFSSISMQFEVQLMPEKLRLFQKIKRHLTSDRSFNHEEINNRKTWKCRRDNLANHFPPSSPTERNIFQTIIKRTEVSSISGRQENRGWKKDERRKTKEFVPIYYVDFEAL